MRYLTAIAIVGCLAACTGAGMPFSEAERPVLERILQIRELRTTTGAAIWQGLDAVQYDTPLLYYTDSVCYAVNPTQQFRDQFGARLAYRDPEIEIYKAILPDSLPFHMETQLDFGDSSAFNSQLPFLFCSSPELTAETIPDVTTDSIWLPMVLHEYVHGFQFRQPGFAAAFAREQIAIPEAELAKLHKRYDWLNQAIKAENNALLAALEVADAAIYDSCIGRFRSLRAMRKQRMADELGRDTVRAEEVFELMEGGARFVEAHVGRKLGVYSEVDRWLYDTDASGYFFAMGYNLMRLLDKCGIEKSRLYTERILPLEAFLTTEN